MHYRAIGQVLITIPFNKLVEGDSEIDVRQYIYNKYESKYHNIHEILFESVQLEKPD